MNSTRVGSVVTVEVETVSLEVVSRLITGAEYIMLTLTDPKEVLVTMVVL